MKKMIVFVLLFRALTCLSQDCGSYYFMQNNRTVEIAITNKKGKESGKSVYTISNVNKKGSATVATINSEFIDKNGKSVSKSTSNVQCENGELMIDMKMFISAEQQQQMGDISASGATNFLEYPSTMKEGDALKDGSLSMDFKSTSGIGGHISIDMTNRKVTGKESVTTPAGTWDCYKITYHSKMVFKIGIGIPINMDVTEWYAPGFGTVKTESNSGNTEIVSLK